MREPEILAVLTDLARAELALERAIEPGAALIDDLGLDSMTATALVVAIEDHFRVCLPDDELRAARRVEDLVAIVARRLAC